MTDDDDDGMDGEIVHVDYLTDEELDALAAEQRAAGDERHAKALEHFKNTTTGAPSLPPGGVRVKRLPRA